MSRKILVADPSRIVGIGSIEELEKADVSGNNWEEYSLIKSLRIKKEILKNSVFYFNGYFFQDIFITLIYEIFKDTKDVFEFKIITNNKGNSALLLKWYDDYCIVCAERSGENFVFEKGGVTYLSKFLNDKDEWEERARYFSELKNGLATFPIEWGTSRWNVYLMTKDYLFEQIEETGSFLDV